VTVSRSRVDGHVDLVVEQLPRGLLNVLGTWVARYNQWGGRSRACHRLWQQPQLTDPVPNFE
jgi:hypothetical protein